MDKAHEAPLLASNLAPGATPERLAHAEVAFGFALPADLRALWSLHDGQRDERNGFVEEKNFLSVEWAIAQRESVLTCMEFAREDPDAWERAGGTLDELRSDHWIPFAAQDSDSLAVSGVTGRVFACDHDDAPKLLASSFVEWLEGYAVRVEAGDYAVEEGFGDYYLQLRDRAAEQWAQRHAEERAALERFRRETPLLDQLRLALAKRDEDRCTEVLGDALERGDREAFDAAASRTTTRPSASPEVFSSRWCARSRRKDVDAAARANGQGVESDGSRPGGGIVKRAAEILTGLVWQRRVSRRTHWTTWRMPSPRA